MTVWSLDMALVEDLLYKGWTQVRIAGYLGVNPSTVCRALRAQREQQHLTCMNYPFCNDLGCGPDKDVGHR